MLVLIPLLFLAVVFLAVFWRVLKGMVNGVKKEFDWLPYPAVVEQTQHEAAVVSVPDEAIPEVAISPLVVRQMHVNTLQATLLVRYRARKKACTAHLIVWSGAKRRRIQDSYYDLGLIPADQVDDAMIDEFMAIASQKLVDLKNAGIEARNAARLARKAKSVAGEEVQPVVELLSQPALATEVEVKAEVMVKPAVSIEPDNLTKLRPFPSVFRGTILEVGIMSKDGEHGPYDVFGVKYRTPEGSEDAIFGSNLRHALQEAMAGVGDHVEILKIGRKTVEKGKAPMNLFSVSKLATVQTVQTVQ